VPPWGFLAWFVAYWTQALLKAREVSHALKLLCGPELQQVVRLVGQHPGDPAPGEDGYLMRMVTVSARSGHTGG
jgi:hypothetical protein